MSHVQPEQTTTIVVVLNWRKQQIRQSRENNQSIFIWCVSCQIYSEVKLEVQYTSRDYIYRLFWIVFGNDRDFGGLVSR
jgi:hypothetical protein